MVNQHNGPYYACDNSLHSPKVTVWCAVNKTVIIGLYFFAAENLFVLNYEETVFSSGVCDFSRMRRRVQC